MQSYSNNWDETFRYLSHEFLAPELVEADSQQQNLSPPVRFGPCPRIFAMALTSLRFVPVAGLGYLLAIFRGECDNCLSLDYFLSGC